MDNIYDTIINIKIEFIEGGYDVGIERVEIFLDDNVPEYMEGIIRCESVISYDEDNKSTNHQDLIDNSEYESEKELLKDIASRLNVSKSIIEIMGE